MLLINNASEQKLRGGFYTPTEIASFILKWALNGREDADILEPSCGDGVFLKPLREKNYNSLTAVEIDIREAAKANKVVTEESTIIVDDFHAFANRTELRFDVIVGNPPYIRYQYFSEEQQNEAKVIFERAGLKYSKLMNAWVSFVVGSTLLLSETGKIGFVLPAEILQVSYAKSLRNYLARVYNKINIVSFKKLVFPDIQQEVVLLLCEKNNNGTHFIEHIEVEDANGLKNLNPDQLRFPTKEIDFHNNKWTFYFLEQYEIDFLEEVLRNNLTKIGDYAKVEVGITTGANKFFTVTQDIVQQYNLQQYARPMVGRSVQVSSVRFTHDDWLGNVDNGARANFLMFPKISEINGNTRALDYLEYGKLNKIHEGYKCSIRDEWQVVPSTRVSDALFIRRNSLYPRLIINDAEAHTTDTMHRVWINDSVNKEAFASSYYNSLSLAFAEICGRSHGGGVLELMPNEAEAIPLPYNSNNSEMILEIDEMLRNNSPIENILELTNERILKLNLGLNNREINLADNIRRKLSSRRINRGKKS